MLGFTFNGVHSSVHGIYLTEIDRDLLSGRDNKYERVPKRPGSILVPGELKDKSLDYNALVEWRGQDEMEDQFDDIADWLDTDDKKLLILDSKPDWGYKAILNGSLNIPETEATRQAFRLRFMAEPYQYAAVETSAGVTTAGTVVNAGRLDVAPLLVITMQGSVSNLTITNNTNAESCVITGVLAGGSVVEIDGGYQTVKTVKIDGANGLARFSGTWPRLVPGVNSITVSSSNAAATFSFRGMRR